MTELAPLQAYHKAKRDLIAYAVQLIRALADDAEFCEAFASKAKTSPEVIRDGLRRQHMLRNSWLEDRTVSGTDSDHNEQQYSTSILVSIPTIRRGVRRISHRWQSITIPMSALASKETFTEWRNIQVEKYQEEWLKTAKHLCQQRRDIAAAIDGLPDHLKAIALGAKKKKS